MLVCVRASVCAAIFILPYKGPINFCVSELDHNSQIPHVWFNCFLVDAIPCDMGAHAPEREHL